MTDPRPDLKYDSQEWTNLLLIASDKNLMLAGVLHGFRCCGLRLHKGKDGYVLRPDLDPESSKWTTKEQYFEDRDRWLVPHQEEIVELLNLLGG
jgi:hypothetical protein